MGHREDLLEGAKRCLHEKGYARTTARDIVAASGTNLASIGYHFGSKEALLNAALIEAITDMGNELIRTSTKDMAGPRAADLARGWDKVIARFAEYRPLLVAQLEAWAQLERSPELREELANRYEQDRAMGVEVAQQAVPSLDERTARALAAVTSAIADGLVVQWLLDPERAPDGSELVLGLQALTSVLTGTPSTDTPAPGDSVESSGT
ncbi:TetR/AcrR family transcriptional regulator [Phytoactinopolyspora mesophila]|uniref:TetR family transcriptional regulator n=1 Tax=Phytoactinopolyspora mesophila TaxID=2650750 RepID=A0A7K3MAK1_9ACTN|nr:TetR/AcrR family transcriptional regulator [Phytoactinopolyspora mesophila]NDL60057.1 TetR family transcriptional regulator [Phytoactinopolyspora mesophila]